MKEDAAETGSQNGNGRIRRREAITPGSSAIASGRCGDLACNDVRNPGSLDGPRSYVSHSLDRSRCVGPFCPPPTGQQGDFGRTVLRGFGAFQADFAVQRRFPITERVNLLFQGEFFNIFNHPNFGPPIGDLTSSQFGYSTATLASSLGSGGGNGGLNPLYQIGGPRSIQLALKLQF